MIKRKTLSQVLAGISLIGLLVVFVLLGIFDHPFWFFVVVFMPVTLWAIDGQYRSVKR